MDTVESLFAELRQELETYLTPEQIRVIYQAYRLAADAHEGQLRQSGEPYISHPLAVARILAGMRLDYQSILVAILHDVIEDTGIQKESLAAFFGDEVAELVDGVSKLTQIDFGTRAEAQAENFRKMVLAMVRDIRVILVKLADRLHNMRTLSGLSPEKQHRIALETLEIHAPIANRLGMHNFRIELEDLSFAALYPMRYRILNEAVRKARGPRKEMINIIKTALKDRLESYHLPSSSITGRQKHLYGIYQKMKKKHLSLSEIMDVYGFRIVVDSIDSCYRGLGVVHNLYKPVPERFKDYIAIPKVNGYQSLHTTLFGPHGVPIEIQIRTADMEHIANNGIAAHWLYKTDEKGVPSDAEVRMREWLKGLLELQNHTGNSMEFIEHVKVDLFPDEVYVFTPAGAIIELPTGATAVDFAYAVHSDLGNSCVGVKIDRRLAPLSTPLVNGQTVEVLTASDVSPNPIWLNFVVTGKARGNIRHFLKTQHRDESITLGQQLITNVLTTLGFTWAKLPTARIKSLLKSLNYASTEDLFVALGVGHEIPLIIASRLTKIAEAEVSRQLQLLSTTETNTLSLVIKGTKGWVVTFAECCRPIPGDPIVGIMDMGQGIVIHTEHCRQLAKSHIKAARYMPVPVRWEEQIQAEFKANLRCEMRNQRGVLAKLASTIARADANIENVVLREHEDDHYSIVSLTVSVRDRVHLAQVIRRIRILKETVRIVREK
jgi:GTP diphosphokinase / guanosine-3',5'-bis(diphosphate) 3'-diphosphatase